MCGLNGCFERGASVPSGARQSMVERLGDVTQEREPPILCGEGVRLFASASRRVARDNLRSLDPDSPSCFLLPPAARRLFKIALYSCCYLRVLNVPFLISRGATWGAKRGTHTPLPSNEYG